MSKIPLRVLILDDIPSDAQLMVAELCRADFEVDWRRVDTEAQFLAELEAAPEVILGDYHLSQFSVLRALAILRERGLDVPLIVVSGSIGEETAVDALKQGAVDYIWKDRLVRLGPAVKMALDQRHFREIDRLATAQLRLQGAAMEAATHGIVITDREGTIVYVNSATTFLTGYPEEELLGQNPRILKSGRQGPQVYADLWKTIQAGKVWQGEMINRRKDGSHYIEIMTITPVPDEHGKITHFIAIKKDITDRKELEAQFLQAQKMEAFGQLAGGVAHDFNNLLTVISGFTELLLTDRSGPEESQELLRQIKGAAERATGLTNQLLAFSRKQVLQPRVLDLGDLVAEQEKMLRRLIGEDIQLIVQRDPDLRVIRADPGLMQQVILNLAINARDAMPMGGKLTLVTRNVNVDEDFASNHPKTKPGSYVLLEVNDTGCGMSQEVLARIFEPFFTTKGVGKGTGLGLATVLGIVDQSGGVIDVESRPGQGSTFRIFLPRTGASLSEIRKPQLDTLMRGQETILLVEDDDGVRSLAAMILSQRGFTVLEARNGSEGVEVFRQYTGPIHLLLTDVVMPEMSGPQLAALLSCNGRPPKVLFMSGYLDDAVVRHGVLETELAFLQKPFTPAGLLRKVREMLDEKN